MAHHPRTLIVFNASKMRWLDASWTRMLIGARMRCYIDYTGCPSVIVLTLNLLNTRSSLVHLLLACTFIHQSLDTCHLALSALGSRAFRVAAPTVFNSLPQDIRSTDNISAFCRLLKTFYFRASDSTYVVDIARVKKFILTYLLTYLLT